MAHFACTSDRGPWTRLVESRSEDSAIVHQYRVIRDLLISYHVKRVTAFTNEQGAVIPGKLAGRTSAIELNATYTTHLVFGHVPSPRSNSMPFLYDDFHLA